MRERHFRLDFRSRARCRVSAGRIYVGIDPGQFTGLVAVQLPPGSLRVVDARLIGFGVVSAAKKGDETWARAQSRAGLFHKIRTQLETWRPDVVVIEEPWDALPSWNTRTGGQGGGSARTASVLELATGKAGKARGSGGASRGTIFGVGVHFGLALAAASDIHTQPSIATYPVTTQKAKRGRDPQLGWMQRRNGHIPKHEDTALACALRLRELKARPVDGVLPTLEALNREENDNVYMALGVLMFHLDRERGIV